MPIYNNLNNTKFKSKIAGFDFDWTLVNPKDDKTFPSDINDWEWYYESVPEKIKEYYQQDYMIVIFTNQSKNWKTDQIQLVLKTLEIPVYVVIANKKDEYKPNKILFDKFLEENKFDENEINKKESFFVGDAVGRNSDYSDVDLKFAENIGIRCFTPEEIFFDGKYHVSLKNIKKIPLLKKQEIVIMMGYPGSGKSTIANHICNKYKNHTIIAGDIYKTTSKMFKASKELIENKQSIIFDATNSNIKKRKEYIDFANKNNYQIKCIHVTTSLNKSFKQNKLRNDSENKHVPRIAYNVYNKYYEEPNENEGLKLYVL